MPSRLSMRRPPNCELPWQLKQLLASTGRTLVSKKSADAAGEFCAGRVQASRVKRTSRRPAKREVCAWHSGVDPCIREKDPERKRHDRGSGFPDEGTQPDRGKTRSECKGTVGTDVQVVAFAVREVKKIVYLGRWFEVYCGKSPRPCRLNSVPSRGIVSHVGLFVLNSNYRGRSRHACNYQQESRALAIE